MTTKIKSAEDLIGKEFVITREYAAPREMVWRACTEARHLAQWWGPRGFSAPVCEWDAKPGNKIYVVMRAPNGTDFPMGGKFHEVIAPEKLVTTTGALDEKGNLLFEFHHILTLVGQPDGKTKLTMRSRLTNIFVPEAAKYIGGFEAGMTQSLERLADLVENGPLIIERTFAAPVQKVWKAITNRDDMARWFFDMQKFKPEAGCEFQFVVEHEGNKHDHRCKVTEVIPQKKIAYTWRYEGHEGNSLVTFELFAEGNKTKLKLTHEGLETFPKTLPFARKNFLRGWTSLIGAELKKFAESKN
ncbi:MAG: SRPBCC family protein [Limisphaerales bacterium]